MDFLDSHALHLNKPPSPADGSLDNNVGHALEAHVEHLLDHHIVGYVAQVDYHLADILVGAVGLFQQGFDILPHALCLFDDVFGVFNLALVVDAGRSGYEYMTSVAVVDVGTSLERHTIVAGAVEVSGGIEIVNLFLLNTCNGVVVHLGENVGVSLSPSDACGGDEMGVDCQSLCEEELVSGSYHTAVVEVNIVDEDPGSHTVGLQCTTFFQ